MKSVGDHLMNVALKSHDSVESNLYGRSAFNRYYYSAFLKIRSTLKTIDPQWAKPAHKQIPALLNGQVKSRAKSGIEKAQSANLITHSEGSSKFNSLKEATLALVNILNLAREIRRLADYEPETLVERNGNVMILGSCKISSAQNWERVVDSNAKTILRIYGELGLI